jgi:hypothetical protein
MPSLSSLVSHLPPLTSHLLFVVPFSSFFIVHCSFLIFYSLFRISRYSFGFLFHSSHFAIHVHIQNHSYRHSHISPRCHLVPQIDFIISPSRNSHLTNSILQLLFPCSKMRSGRGHNPILSKLSQLPLCNRVSSICIQISLNFIFEINQRIRRSKSPWPASFSANLKAIFHISYLLRMVSPLFPNHPFESFYPLQ